ncbi:MAG TPA: type II toxin-antitoxin system prevent-host-death family antitoxin [Vicinamibacterales bacterium]|jgi:prevent-host-death family protein
MQTIGVRELKSQLSECLRRVEAGEQMTVTDRGRPIATLAPIERAPAVEWARVMAAKGRAAWAGGRPQGLKRRIRSRGTPASRMVIEDRR